MSRVIHFEIMAKDPGRITEFFKQAFGWKINAWEMPGMTYWLVNTGPKSQTGIDGGIMGEMGTQPVINTVEVRSFKAAQGKIEQAGGKLVRGPVDIPDVGLHGYFADPEGTLFGVLEPPAKMRMQGAAAGTGRAGRGRAKPAARKAAKRGARKAKPAAKTTRRKAGGAKRGAARGRRR